MKYILIISMLFPDTWAIAQNTGINTISPSEKLDVTGNVKAGGFIATDSIKIIPGAVQNRVFKSDVNGKANWGSMKLIPGTVFTSNRLSGVIAASVPIQSAGWEFLGPFVNVNFNGNQSMIINAVAVLGRTTAGAVSFNMDVGYQPFSGGSIINAATLNYLSYSSVFGAGDQRCFKATGKFKPPTSGLYHIGCLIWGPAGSFNQNNNMVLTYMIVND